MPDRNEVRKRFIELIKPFIRQDPGQEITDDTFLDADLRVNSARMIDIVLESEDAFNILSDDASMGRLDTVGAAVTVIMEKLP
jgi:acyl carrier protein